MANPELYPGAPDYRNAAPTAIQLCWRFDAPNIRSALFTLPIERLTIATNELYGRGASLSQTNNGSATDASFAGGFKSGPEHPLGHAVQQLRQRRPDQRCRAPRRPRSVPDGAANPANGQFPSRGDFMAQILQYRMRGADSINCSRRR